MGVLEVVTTVLYYRYCVDFLVAEHEKSGWCGSSFIRRELPEEFGRELLLSISRIVDNPKEDLSRLYATIIFNDGE